MLRRGWLGHSGIGLINPRPSLRFDLSNFASLRLDFLHELRLQFHGADAVDLAIDVVVGFGRDANIFHLGAYLKGGGGAFDLEVLGELDGITGVEFVAVGVAENESLGSSGGFLGRPFVFAIGTGKKRAVFVSVFGVALGAVWDVAHGRGFKVANGEWKGVNGFVFR
jgi:hypothetical protein